MKKQVFHTLLLLFISLTITACNKNGFGPCIRGNDDEDSQSRALAEFTKIDFQMEGKLIIRKAPENRIVIEGNSNQIAEAKSRVEDGKLKIYSDRCLKNTDFKFVVYTDQLEEIRLAGSGNAQTEDIFDAEKLNIELSGSGKISVKSESDWVTAKVSGSGDVYIEGSCSDFEAQISGSGKIHGYPLVSEKASVNISGSGNLEIFVSNELNANISGSGGVRYKGNPGKVNSSISGSGKIVGVE
ncbi:head GIN domain-containing protein [Desertivirga xinjiangensis]|uniref:head GIN domain-containing protein n=1 Tax=Desertivirga xinjiangensis TaxID=539206 RepID=UPI00210C2D4E|nr:head GIN domain-containing protein [Pedobacter xinjiangensis]